MMVAIQKKVNTHKRLRSTRDRRRKAELHRLVEEIPAFTYDDAIGYMQVLSSLIR